MPLLRPAAPAQLAAGPRIWAVGGGKGGVGKSVVISSLACALAGLGRRCALVDLDLGGANLHTLLGTSRPRRTLSHFMDGEVGSLEDLMIPTSVPNLLLVGGNDASPEMANPKHCRKQKLFRHLRELDVDELLVDLGGGSVFNVLDSFLLAARGLVVVTPESTAIENAEHFLEAALHRALHGVARCPDVRRAILRVRERQRGRRLTSARELIALVKCEDPLAGKLLEERAEAFAPLLLVNQVENAQQRGVGPELAERCRERLGVSIAYAGYLEADRSVRDAIARRQPVQQLFSRCSFSRRIEELARCMVREEGSAHLEYGDRCATRGRPDEVRAPLPVASTRSLPTLDLGQPGTYLRRCRKQLGLSLSEMIERTRIHGLGDLERERFDSLPPEPYLRGFVLEYARELGIRELGALAASYVDRYRRATAGDRLQ
jgi:flagellar biosynthesis protein FlhG